MERTLWRFFWMIPLLLSSTTAQNRPSPFNPSDENVLGVAMSRIEHLLRNDELECLPRLLCEYAAGGTPGQGRAVNVDIKSLFTLLQYLGLDQSNDASPMLSFAKAASLGFSHRGDSYECYRSYPRCPRDQGRLLYYLNNHRGGFFRGFGGYYHRNNIEDHIATIPGQSNSRIVNNKFAHNIASVDFPPYANDEIYSTGGTFSKKPEFVFSNDYRRPKELLGLSEGTDRLPNRLYFPTAQESGSVGLFNSYNEVGSSFFPQN